MFCGAGRIQARKRYRRMLVDRLGLIIIIRMREFIGTGDRHRRLISLEAQVELLLSRSQFIIIQTSIAEHQVVMSFQVFRINALSLVILLDGLSVFALQEKQASHLISHDTIVRVTFGGQSKLMVSLRVFTI